MTVDVWNIASYGCHDITFKKRFELPFAPFFGLTIFDSDGTGSYEIDVRLENTDHRRTTIVWDAHEQKFLVDSQELWKWPIAPENIDSRILQMTVLGWERTDSTNVDSLKELMKADYERQNRKH